LLYLRDPQQLAPDECRQAAVALFLQPLSKQAAQQRRRKSGSWRTVQVLPLLAKLRWLHLCYHSDIIIELAHWPAAVMMR
jgi:hypothetical protein